MAPRPRRFGVNLPPIGMSSSGQRHNNHAITINKVRETLRLFQVVCRKLLQEEEAKSKEQRKTNRGVDQKASKILKKKGKDVNTREKSWVLSQELKLVMSFITGWSLILLAFISQVRLE